MTRALLLLWASSAALLASAALTSASASFWNDDDDHGLSWMSPASGFSAMGHAHAMLRPYYLQHGNNGGSGGGGRSTTDPGSLLSAADYAYTPKHGNRRKRSIHSGFFTKSRSPYGYGYGYRPVYGLGPYRRFYFGRRGYRNKVYTYKPGGILFHH